MTDGSDFMFATYMYIIYDEMILALCAGGRRKTRDRFKYMCTVKVATVFKLNIGEHSGLNTCSNKYTSFLCKQIHKRTGHQTMPIQILSLIRLINCMIKNLRFCKKMHGSREKGSGCGKFIHSLFTLGFTAHQHSCLYNTYIHVLHTSILYK